MIFGCSLTYKIFLQSVDGCKTADEMLNVYFGSGLLDEAEWKLTFL
jgi:hypothetical protein